MPFLILGLFALVVVLLAAQWFSSANTSLMARQLRMAGGTVALAVAGAFFVRGALNQAIILGLFGASLLGWRNLGAWGGFPSWGQPSSGQTSHVATEHLEMELDHDSGAIAGRVIKGRFAGRDLESLSPAELGMIWQDCQWSDPKSAQILEAYLDRVHPDWRGDLEREYGAREDRAGARATSGGQARMSAAHACEVLGLKTGASKDDIRRAHRDLMRKLHPDVGGSTFLAAQINEAKAVLLGE